MERKKRRWLLGCAFVGVAVLGVLVFLVWMRALARAKPGPVVEVVTCYPGMPAASIEKTITNRIERWVNQAPEVKLITSRSLNGVSVVRVDFRNDIDPNTALTQVGELALGTLPTLPPNTLPPVVLPWDPRCTEPMGMLAVNSTMVNEVILRELADAPIRERLRIIPGAVAPLVLGGKERTLVIQFNAEQMAACKVTPEDVRTALKTAYDKSRVFAGKDYVLLEGSVGTINLDKLSNLDVRAENGEVVELGRLGIVRDQSAAPTVRFRIEGRPAVGVPVYLQQGTKRQSVDEKIVNALPSLQDELPPGVQPRWVPLRAEHRWLRPQDDGLLTIYLRASSSSRLTETEKRVAAVEDFLQKSIPPAEREAIVSEVGLTPDWEARYTANAGPMDATIFVQLSGDRALSAAEYAAKLRRGLNDDPQFADLRFRFASRDMPAPVDIRISGGAAKEAMELAQEIRQRLAGISGTVDVDVAQGGDVLAPVEIDHDSLQRALDVRANIEGRGRGDVLADIRKMLQELQVLKGARVELVE